MNKINKNDKKVIRNCSIITLEKIDREIKEYELEIERLQNSKKDIKLMNKKLDALNVEEKIEWKSHIAENI